MGSYEETFAPDPPFTEFSADDRARLIRIESRLCQLMQHMGLDPHHKIDEPLPQRHIGVWKSRDPK
jgi:hypothetical protein